MKDYIDRVKAVAKEDKDLVTRAKSVAPILKAKLEAKKAGAKAKIMELEADAEQLKAGIDRAYATVTTDVDYYFEVIRNAKNQLDSKWEEIDEWKEVIKAINLILSDNFEDDDE